MSMNTGFLQYSYHDYSGRVLRGPETKSDSTIPGATFRARHAGLFLRLMRLSVLSVRRRFQVRSDGT